MQDVVRVGGNGKIFINKIKASLDITRAADISTTSVDLAENKEKINPTQIQTLFGKTDTDEKTAIKPTTGPDKTLCNKISY